MKARDIIKRDLDSAWYFYSATGYPHCWKIDKQGHSYIINYHGSTTWARHGELALEYLKQHSDWRHCRWEVFHARFPQHPK